MPLPPLTVPTPPPTLSPQSTTTCHQIMPSPVFKVPTPFCGITSDHSKLRVLSVIGGYWNLYKFVGVLRGVFGICVPQHCIGSVLFLSPLTSVLIQKLPRRC